MARSVFDVVERDGRRNRISEPMAPTLDQDSSRRPLVALRARALRGRFRAAPEPILFTLSACLASLARGRSVLYADTGGANANRGATQRLLEAVGVPLTVAEDRWEIDGLGPRGWLEPRRGIDFSGAGRVAPLALAVLGSLGIPARLVGDLEPGASLAPAMDQLRRIGVVFDGPRTGELPLAVGGMLVAAPFALRLEQPAPAVKSALLLAAAVILGRSTLEELPATADHAERLLRHFGASVTEATLPDGVHQVSIGGPAPLGARTLTPVGDMELALFAVLAALIVPDSEVSIENVPMHPDFSRALAALGEMGGDITVVERRTTGGEELADLKVRHSALLGVRLDTRRLSPVELTTLAVAGAFAAGEMQLSAGAAGPSPALRRLGGALADNGAAVQQDTSGLRIGRPAPGRRLGGGVVVAGDAATSAAMLVFALAAQSEVVIEDAGAVERSFPGLIAGLEGLGAEFDWRDAA